MFDLIASGGWMMVPILICSIIAMAIVFERIWSLRTSSVMPPDLITDVVKRARQNKIDNVYLRKLKVGSPLGAIVAAALTSQHLDHKGIQDQVELAGRQVVHELERYLNTLGTIASISPYMGLLGSVLGMMKVFATFSAAGNPANNPSVLAGGISEILVATAAGLAVAIPSLIFYRYFQGRVAELTVRMEEEAVQLMDHLTKPPTSTPPSP